ncbi:MAG: amino acid ABC transporter permease [Planctomycetota bacterium]|jgi:polar amino acid transport system permease protein|nr:amino acid ABC transporter permease [Planctomycetota bacterium]
MPYQFSFEPIYDNWGILAEGVLTTLGLTLAGGALGLGLGVLGAVVRFRRTPVQYQIVTAYVEMVRNTPFLIQLYFIFFGLPSLGLRLAGWQASILAMALNLGAYSTEIIRAGLESLPRGLFEAAAALSLTPRQTLRLVLLKPALKNVWPSLCSQVIIVMLGSSVCSQLAVVELTSAASLLQARTFRAFELYLFATAVYLLLAVLIRFLLRRVGRRFIARGRP